MTGGTGLLDDFERQGIALWLENGQLRYRGSDDVLTERMLSRLREAKPELISLLSDEALVPMGPARRRFWFLDRLYPKSPAYIMPAALKLTGSFQVAALTDVLSELVRRHEALRTTFEEVNGEPRARVLPPTPVELPVEDLTETPDAGRESVLANRLEDWTRRAFDLGRGPVARFALLRFSDEDHVLLVALHHIAADGASLAVLAREFVQLFGADTPSAIQLPPASRLSDAIRTKIATLTPDITANLLGYWQSRLAGVDPIMLPTDRPRPPRPSFAGGAEPIRLGKARCSALVDLARAQNVTVFSLIMSLYAILLHRYSMQTDFVIGAPVADRASYDAVSVVGPLLNTVAFRVEIDRNLPFDRFVRALHARVVNDLDHRAMPFETLVDHMALDRDLAVSPLFQASLNLQDALPDVEGVGDLQARLLELPAHAARNDLHLDLSVGPEELRGRFEYAKDLFESETIAIMARSFINLIDEVLTEPERRLRDLRLSSPMDAEAGVRLVNAGSVSDIPASPAPDEAVALHAAERPESVAVVCGATGQTLSYGALNARADSLACRLSVDGVGYEDRVALVCDRGPNLIAAMVAVLRLGATYIPLDPAMPKARLEYILRDADVGHVLVDTSGAQVCADLTEPRVVSLFDAKVSGETGVRVAPVQAPDETLAYIIYTSGSTGSPRGVGISRRALARLLNAGTRKFSFDHQDVWTLFHAPGFDFSVWEIWGALRFGGKLVVVPRELTRAPAAFLELLRRNCVTVLNQTPSAFEMLRDEVLSSNAALPPSVRCIIFGGESLTRSVLRPWIMRFGADAPELINMYGITETTVHVTCHRVEVGDGIGPRCAIGRPLDDMRLYLLDDNLMPVPQGVPGELYVGGTGVARGYVGMPRETAMRFLPDPFGERPGARMFRSGDVAVLRFNGRLEFLGRRDNQVKIRGFRIKLDEVRLALTAHKDIRQAAVLVKESGAGDLRLVAYLVTVPDATLSANDVRSHLIERLPHHMVPTAFVFVSALPMTENGKLDTALLPPPGNGTSEGQAELSRPRTMAETVLVEAIKEVLELRQLGVDENFFTVGGDSIQALRVQALAAKRGLRLGVEDIFVHQTPARIAGAAHVTEEEAVQTEHVPFSLLTDAQRKILPHDAVDAYPLTSLQEAMLFASEREQDALPYQDVFALSLDRLPPLDRLRKAIDRAVARHPVLRTSLHLSSPGEPLQIVHSHAEMELELLSESAEPASLQTRVTETLQRTFDIERAPLARLSIVRNSNGGGQLVLTFHHAILDGWSAACLLTELFQDPATLPPPPQANFRDFVLLEREALANRATWEFWNDQLAQDTSAALPSEDDIFAENLPFEVNEIAVPDRLHDALRETSIKLGVSIKILLMAAHFRVVASLTGARHVVSGCTVGGRPETQDGDRALGLFINMLPIGVTLSGNWRDLIGALNDAEQALMPHRRMPAAALRQMRDGKPPFDVAFNYVDFHIYDVVADRTADDLDVVVHEQTDLPFMATFGKRPRDGRFSLRLVRKSGVFSTVCFENLPSHYVNALTSLVEDPDGSLAAARLLDETEWDTVVRNWGSGTSVCSSSSVLDLFCRQLAARPDSPAIVGPTDRDCISYADLNRRASNLAGSLRREHRIGGETVAVLLPRGADLVVAMLGIVMAGANYLPLDRGYPVERLNWMLSTTGARLVLTDSAGEPLLEEAMPKGTALVTDWTSFEPTRDEFQPPQIDPMATAYVNFTSGSTGKPKGIAIPHCGIARLIADRDVCRMGPGTATLFYSSPSFDVTTLEVWGPLLTGGRVVISPETGDIYSDLRTATGLGVTNMFLTAALFRELVESEIELLAGVDHLISGGEPVSPPHMRRLSDRYPHVRMTVGYGPTENTTFSTSFTNMTPNGPVDDAIVIGRPVAGTTAYVLDAFGQPAPIGANGHLHVGGSGVAHGYLGRPALTAERFLCSNLTEPGGRLYQTGDRARWRGDGQIEFLGRADRQIKIRGFRIEPGEIEAALKEQKEVDDALVTAKTDSLGDARLSAYVVAAAGTHPKPSDLLVRLVNKLPVFMIPEALVVLDRLPLSPNGKLDEAALPAAEPNRPAHLPPRTETESRLGGLWRDVLDIPEVGVSDNFFKLGGHSLLALRLIARIRAEWKVDLPMSIVFESGTLGDLAATLDDHLPDKEASRSSAFLPLPYLAPPAEAAPLQPAPVQEHYLHLRDQGGFANAYTEFRIHGCGPEFATALESAAWRLVDQHGLLRHSFADGAHFSLAASPDHPMVDVTDLRNQADGVAQRTFEDIRRRLQFAAPAPCHLPLFDLHLVFMPDGTVRLLFRLDALIADGQTRVALLQDLLALVSDPDWRGHHSAFPFTDWLAVLPSLRQTDQWKAARDAWRDVLDGLPAPFQGIRPSGSGHLGSTLTRRTREILPASLWQDLRAGTAERGTTPSVLLTASHATGLARVGEGSPFVMWQATGYRPPVHPAINRTVGNFTTILPVAVHDAATATNDRIKDIETQLRALLDHRLYSGFEAVAQLAKERGVDRTSWLGAMVNCLVDYGPRPNAHTIAVGGAAAHAEVVDETLYVGGMVVGASYSEAEDGALLCSLVTDDDRLERGFAERLFDALGQDLGRLTTPQR